METSTVTVISTSGRCIKQHVWSVRLTAHVVLRIQQHVLPFHGSHSDRTQ